MIVAYREQQSIVGILHFKYRARKLRLDEPEIRDRYGSAWLFSYGYPDWVLERQRSHDGKPEGWEPIGFGKTRMDLWDYLDSGVTITDPRFQARQAQHEAEVETARIEAAERAARQQEIDKAEDIRKRSEAAFVRLAHGKDGHWAEAWLAFARRARAVEGFVEHAQKDASLVDRFNAVLSATTVRTKRAAIKRALDYMEKQLEGFCA